MTTSYFYHPDSDTIPAIPVLLEHGLFRCTLRSAMIPWSEKGSLAWKGFLAIFLVPFIIHSSYVRSHHAPQDAENDTTVAHF